MNKENKEKVKKNVCQIKYCGRPTHKESKYCIFHAKAEEKTEKEFIEALKEYVDKIKEKDKDYDFNRFIFVGNIDFRKDLGITIFKNADFRGATFKGDVKFVFTTFRGSADFDSATFGSNVNFGDSTFDGYVNFWVAIFEGNTDFSYVNFESDVTFGFITCKSNANFRGATFKGDADFSYVNFEGDAYFSIATFKMNSNFYEATFKDYAEFNNTTLPSGNILSLKVKNRGIISFMYTSLENIFLNLNLAESVLINFEYVMLRNTKMKKDDIDGHILQEKNKDFSRAREIYLLLKNNFHSIGRYDDEGWAFKKEKYMERLSYSFYPYRKALEKKVKKERFPIIKWICTKDFNKWIQSLFSNLIYGYGEEPRNVVITGLVIIFLFALIFSYTGIGSPEFIELKGSIIQEVPGNDIEIIFKGSLQNRIIKHFFKSLYFSLITFTTLGYGDLRPLEGCGRIFAGGEAFIGAIMMALFVYTFARRTGGR